MGNNILEILASFPQLVKTTEGRTLLGLLTAYAIAWGFFSDKMYPWAYMVFFVGWMGVIKNRDKAKNAFLEHFDPVEILKAGKNKGLRHQLHKTAELLESLLGKSHLNILGNTKAGKTVFLADLARKIYEKRGVQAWYCRGMKLQTGEDVKRAAILIQTYWGKYCEGVLHRDKFAVIFWDEPVSSQNQELLQELYDKFPPDRKLTFVTTFSWSNRYLKPGGAVPKDDYTEEDDDAVVSVALDIKHDLKQLLAEYCQVNHIAHEQSEKFLAEEPDIYNKCGNDISLLQYRFERFRNKAAPSPQSISGKLETYTGWDVADPKKTLVQFVSFANAMRLTISDKLMASFATTHPLKELQCGEFLSCVDGYWNVKDTFLAYYLLEERVKDPESFAEFVGEIVSPYIDKIAGLIRGAKDDRTAELPAAFLREIVHRMQEEQYRPVINVPGQLPAQALYDRNKTLIHAFLDKLGKTGDADPLQLLRWASTCRRVQDVGRAVDIYSSMEARHAILGTRSKKRLATGWAMLSRKEDWNRALELYKELLAGNNSLVKKFLLHSAIRLSLRMGDAEKALALMDSYKGKVAWDAPLYIERGIILETLQKSMHNDLDPQDTAMECYKKAVKEVASVGSRKTILHANHKYTDFLIAHARNETELIEKQLKETVRIARKFKENLFAVCVLKGRYYSQKKGSEKRADRYFKCAINICKRHGINTAGPYMSYSKFLEGQHQFKAAKSVLREVIDGEFDTFSRRRALNKYASLTSQERVTPQECDRIIEELSGQAGDPPKMAQDYRDYLAIVKLYEKKYFALNSDDSELEYDERNKLGVQCLEKATGYVFQSYSGLLTSGDMDNIQIRRHILKAVVSHAYIMHMRGNKESVKLERSLETVKGLLDKWGAGTMREESVSFYVNYVLYYQHNSHMYQEMRRCAEAGLKLIDGGGEHGKEREIFLRILARNPADRRNTGKDL